MNLMDMLMQQQTPSGGRDFTLGSSPIFSLFGSRRPQTGQFNNLLQLPAQANERAREALAGLPMPPSMPANPPMPPPRPTMPQQAPGAPMQLPSAAQPGYFAQMFGGPSMQSNSMPTVMAPQGPTPGGQAMPQQINWGDPNSAADFFRANQALIQTPGLLGYGG